MDEIIKNALLINLPYEDDATRGQLKLQHPIAAATLTLFGRLDDQPAILFTKRTYTVDTHKGQIAFPGGHCEPHELRSSDLAALRETHEEVGIAPEHVRILGRLPSLVTVTGFKIDPWVGFLNEAIDATQLQINPSELTQAFWVPISTLRASGTYQLESVHHNQKDYAIHVYRVQQGRIWGATGSMTHNLLARMEKVGAFPKR